MNIVDIPGIFYELVKKDNLANNIVGVGQGHKYVRGENTKKETLTILVKKKYRISELQRSEVIPKTIANIATDIIEVGDIRLLKERLDFNRPAQPGMSLGHYKISAGTFGAVVKDKNTGELLLLSNNHVLANITNGSDARASIGDPIIQPGIYDGGNLETSTIAHLAKFVPLYNEIAFPRCKIAQTFEMVLNKCIHLFQPKYQVRVLRESEKLNFVDCAVAAPINPTDISAEILEIGLVAGVKEATLGMPIKKSGRTTGVTSGLVVATNLTVKVSMSNQKYGIFTDQILAGPMSMPGDSGSLVLTNDNYAIGLLFAGSERATMFNKIQHVLDKLDICF
ncbi:hypothetical protein [Sporomusa sp. KB1]|jgi:hypothetical protein|uniref:hypothetical protein n=1 Tax=Sporomusa sp. KB1 TaxID=943346 RepID=UPI0011A409A1|nr:hypothetical protein [Sporomusa sp. KB1]TWH49135.1 hypothetical protein Salpa_5336 [Sporomusa sp. KB1]